MNILHLRRELVQYYSCDWFFPFVDRHSFGILVAGGVFAAHIDLLFMAYIAATNHHRHRNVCSGVSFNRHRTRNDGALSSYAENWCNPFIFAGCGIRSLFPFSDNVSRANNKYRRTEKKTEGKLNANELMMHRRMWKENMKMWKMWDNSCTAEIFNLVHSSQREMLYSRSFSMFNAWPTIANTFATISYFTMMRERLKKLSNNKKKCLNIYHSFGLPLHGCLALHKKQRKKSWGENIAHGK